MRFIIDFSEAFDLVPHDRLLMKLVALGVDSKVVVWVREFLVGRTQYTKGQSRRVTIQGSEINLRCAAKERFGPTTVSIVHK